MPRSESGLPVRTAPFGALRLLSLCSSLWLVFSFGCASPINLSGAIIACLKIGLGIPLIRLQQYFLPLMLRSQVDFLNHGLLPFAGRGDVVGRIVDFWRETAGALGLRALLVVGEAGVGKSRLVEEGSSVISADGGVALATRLYPDSPTALIPLITRALWRNALLAGLLKEEPRDDLGSVRDALIRICGLRPTLLVIEDLHLLGSDGLRDLSLLLDGLADEPMSILFTARPVELAARGVIEPYMVDEIELHGLNDEAIAAIWEELMGETADAALVTALKTRTTGNALALRSALRAGLRDRRRTGNPAADRDLFLEGLERNVRLLSDGMVAHLTDAERAWAAQLAGLGEVFSREAALFLFDEDPHPLDELAFKGIVAVASSLPSPVDGSRSSSVPLSFTHSLLHRHFVDGTRGDLIPKIVGAVAAGLPLYSVLPFELVLGHAGGIALPATTLQAGAVRALAVASALYLSPDWRQANTARRAAELLQRLAAPGLSDKERRDLRSQVLVSLLSAGLRSRTESNDVLLEELLDLTANPSDQDAAALRLRALIPWRRHIRRQGIERNLEPIAEVESLIERFPDLAHSSEYVAHVHDTLRSAIILRDDDLIRSMEERLDRFLTDPATPSTVSSYARRILVPPLLNVYTNPDELARRRRQLADLDQAAADPMMRLNYLIWKAWFLEGLLDVGEALSTIEFAVPYYRDRGVLLEAIDCSRMGIFLRALQHGDLERMAREIDELAVEPSTEVDGALLARKAPIHIAKGGVLLDNPEWLASELSKRDAQPAGLVLPIRVLVMLAFNDTDRLRQLLDADLTADPPFVPLVPLLSYVIDPSQTDCDDVIKELPYLLDRPTLNVDTFALRRAALDLIMMLPETEETEKVRRGARDLIVVGVRELVEWTLSRPLPLVASKLLDRYGRHLPNETLKDLQGRTKVALGESSAPRRGGAHVSMLGAIVIQPEEGEPVRLRGTQLCTLLGLMIATEMLDRPLSSQEATAIVMGNDRDPDAARKAMNFAVFRLRESMGPDAVITGGETPRLNPERVRVDLLDAWRHLRAASTALADGALMRSVPELLAAFEMAGGKVPFPTLYDDFFEALRGDMEAELRETAIRLARLLIREGDNDAAGRVLQSAHRVMPEDEEIVDLLRDTFRALGKRAEAIRVGLAEAE